MAENENDLSPLQDSRLRNRPRLRTLDPVVGERHASWLELFFDLVFVLAVSQVSRVLTEHTDPSGFLKFIVLFVAVWYLWVGYTFYADRFETEEAAYRILMFTGMLAVVGLSLRLGGAFTLVGDAPFIACYIAVQIVLVVLFARAAYYVPVARAYCMQYVIGITMSSLILAGSLLLAPPARYVAWAFSLILQFATPFLNVRATRMIPIDRSHIPERLGLFTILVLGEAVIATATGAASVEWDLATIVTASIGFAMAASIWWINFDFVEDNAIRSNSLLRRMIYLYGNFFIVASIVVVGVGVEHAITETATGRVHFSSLALMAGGVAVYLSTTTVIRLITGVCKMVYVRMTAIAMSLIVLLTGQYLPLPAFAAALFVILASNIWAEGRFSVEHDNDEEDDPVHLIPCEHAGEMTVSEPRSHDGCEECHRNNYKWVHLRLCRTCGHVGCCDSSVHKHATRHHHESGHPIISSLEPNESWAWCYVDERFVPDGQPDTGS